MMIRKNTPTKLLPNSIQRKFGMNRKNRKNRNGLTLIELMIVIMIIGIVSAAAIPLVRTLTADREIREASRMLTTFIEKARTDAMTEGFGGFYIERSSRDPNRGIDLSMLKVFPSYSGDIADTECYFQDANFAHNIFLTRSENGLIVAGRIVAGDEIRFNHKGPWFEIFQVDQDITPTGAVLAAGYVDGNTSRLRIRSYKFRETTRLTGGGLTSYNILPHYPSGAILSYEIRRQPVKRSSRSITLPSNTFVDFSQSGFAVRDDSLNDFDAAGNPEDIGFLGGGSEFGSQFGTGFEKTGGVGIIFASDGSVDYVFHQIYEGAQATPTITPHITVPIESINLLIAFDRTQDDSLTPPDNLADLSNFWINITRSKGKITSAELADASATTTDAAQRKSSRRFARTGLSANGG